MTAEKNESPFAALSWEEQQRRWLEWRSRQLDYRPAEETQPAPKAPGGVPLLAAVGLIFSIALAIYAIRNVSRGK